MMGALPFFAVFFFLHTCTLDGDVAGPVCAALSEGSRTCAMLFFTSAERNALLSRGGVEQAVHGWAALHRSGHLSRTEFLALYLAVATSRVQTSPVVSEFGACP